MQIHGKICSVALAVCSAVTLALAVPAVAQHGGVAVTHAGGYYGGYRGGYYGGYRGYYGYRGWYGGYYYPWAWGGVGLATLPYYWYGVPYYYANKADFLPGPSVGQYRSASPPIGASNQSGGQAPSELFVYPKNDQSQYQQTTDRYECYRWAISQLGYDPTSAGGGTVRRDLTDYNRAQTACLTARGYSIK